MEPTNDQQQTKEVETEAYPPAEPRRILTPGTHLLRAAFASEVDREAVVRGLGRAGFSHVIVDESYRTIPPRTPITIAASLVRPARLVDTAAVRWMGARVLASDPFRELSYKLVPFSLEERKRYELLLVTRMKSHPNRDRIVESLGAMRGSTGFEVEELLMIRRDIRVPGHPDTSAAIWLGIARWVGAPTYANMDDPISFESVVESLVP